VALNPCSEIVSTSWKKTQKQVLYKTRHLIINMNKVHQ